jgi:hypothetical protein
MKLQTLRAFLERLSFILWIVFTIFSISLAGVGIEGMIFAGYMLIVSSTQPVHFPLALVSIGGLGVVLSIVWRQVGVNHFHYLLYDTAIFSEEKSDEPSRVLKDLIHEVEESVGYARNDARAKTKTWLIGHVSSLDEEDILLARVHFGYLLPPEWGRAVSKGLPGEVTHQARVK